MWRGGCIIRPKKWSRKYEQKWAELVTKCHNNSLEVTWTLMQWNSPILSSCFQGSAANNLGHSVYVETRQSFGAITTSQDLACKGMSNPLWLKPKGKREDLLSLCKIPPTLRKRTREHLSTLIVCVYSSVRQTADTDTRHRADREGVCLQFWLRNRKVCTLKIGGRCGQNNSSEELEL